jgi:hypothetical protein
MTIVNFADIFTSDFDEDALTTDKAGERIRNFGHLTTAGDLANGISGDANDVSVRNFGQIETNGLGAAGILVEGENAHIVNHGSVTTHGGFLDPDPAVDGDEFFSEGIFANGAGFHIANYGRVHVEGEISSGLVGVGADGIIVNYGQVESSSIFSAMIVAIGDHGQAINAGHMTGTGDFITGLSAGGVDAVMLNRGRIEISGAEGATGIGGELRDHSQVTNRGIVHIAADDSFGVLARVGEDLQVSNYGRIETEGTFAVGIGTGGLAGHILNAGRVATEGDLSIGVTLGATKIGFVPAADGTIVNRGVIETDGDGAAGVLMNGDGHHLVNSGKITTDGGAADSPVMGLLHAAGVLVSGDDVLVENTSTGVIRSADAASAAVELNVIEQEGLPAADLSARLENSGLIKAASVAILGGAGEESVVNHGLIVGDVLLGDGADSFVFGKGGKLIGDLVLGGGDDLVLVENVAGKAEVADFAAGALGGDVIDVSAFFSSFGDLKAHSSQGGADVVIALDFNDQLVLANTEVSALSDADFLFA